MIWKENPNMGEFFVWQSGMLFVSQELLDGSTVFSYDKENKNRAKELKTKGS